MKLFGYELRKFRQPDIRQDYPLGIIPIVGGKGAVYPSWAFKNLGSIYKTNPQVFAALQIAKKAFIKAPTILYEVQRSKARKPVDNFKRFTELNRKEFTEVESHPILDLLRNPNPQQSEESFKEAYFITKSIFGNVFIQALSPEAGTNAGKPIQLWQLPPEYMKIVINTILAEIVGYLWNFATIQKEIPPEQMCHIKEFNPEFSMDGSHLIGTSPLSVAGKLTTMVESGFDASVFNFQNLGPVGLLSGDWTGDQAAEVQRKYEEKYSGVKHKGRMMVSAGKDHQFIQFGMSPVDLNILESLKFSVRQLAAVWGIPPQLLGDPDGSNYSNLKEARKSLLTACIIPELDKFYGEMNRWLMPRFDNTGRYFLGYDRYVFDELAWDLLANASQLRISDWLSINEQREATGYGRLEGDIYDMPRMDLAPDISYQQPPSTLL